MKAVKFAREQYENLLKLVFLGDWLVNSFRAERVMEFEDLENLLYSRAKNFGLEKLVALDNETKKYSPADFLEETVTHYVEEYDEDNFWGELCQRLGRRDFVRKHGQAAIQKMKLDKMREKEAEFIIKYADEFEKNGLEKLEIANSD